MKTHNIKLQKQFADMVSKENKEALEEMCFNCVENFKCTRTFACKRRKIFQRAIKNLELYKKALDISCKENVNRHLPDQSIYTYVYDEKLNLRISTKEDWLNYYLNKAKEELKNE